MKFVDRIDELQRLKKTIDSERPTFTVVYGRRRLGKSTLIKKALTDNDIYYLADYSEKQHQRQLLSMMFARKFPGFDSVTYPDWESLLLSANYRTEEKFTLCLDEFPYLVKQSPELPSVLQKLIDEKALKYNIILSGSSQQMMYGAVLDSTAPLYGRADAILKLRPLQIDFMPEALGLNDSQCVEEYSIWGGVPRYWELREKYSSLRECLRHEVFSVNGVLYDEVSKLFQDDINDIVKASTIMSYIASGANRISEIAARCQEPATNLSRPMRKLRDLGFVEKEVPFGTDEKNSKKSLYKIADPFLAFYFRFLTPNRSYIELDRMKPIDADLDNHIDEFISWEWEKLCRNAVSGNEFKGIVYGKAQRWWGSVIDANRQTKQIEIDVVAESLDHKYLLVGECKWTNNAEIESLKAELLYKASMLPQSAGKTVIPMLFLKNATDEQPFISTPRDIITAFSNS